MNGGRKSIFIALPAFGQVATTHTLSSLMALAKMLMANGYDYYFSEYSYPDIADSRNMLSTIWWDRSEADHILFVDADMSFDPQMVMDMLAFSKPLVGCLYPKKTYPIKFAGAWGNNGKPEIRDGFMEVDAIGFGVTLIHRSCMQTLLDGGQARSDTRPNNCGGSLMADFGINRLIRAFDKIEGETGDLSEDIAFCHRYKACGGEIWANISHRVVHVGQHGYGGRFADGVEAHASVGHAAA